MIETMMTVSSRHITKETWRTHILDDAGIAASIDARIWLYRLPDTAMESELPSDLAGCAALARANGCDWLLFSDSFEPLSILPAY